MHILFGMATPLKNHVNYQNLLSRSSAPNYHVSVLPPFYHTFSNACIDIMKKNQDHEFWVVYKNEHFRKHVFSMHFLPKKTHISHDEFLRMKGMACRSPQYVSSCPVQSPTTVHQQQSVGPITVETQSRVATGTRNISAVTEPRFTSVWTPRRSSGSLVCCQSVDLNKSWKRRVACAEHGHYRTTCVRGRVLIDHPVEWCGGNLDRRVQGSSTDARGVLLAGASRGGGACALGVHETA